LFFSAALQSDAGEKSKSKPADLEVAAFNRRMNEARSGSSSALAKKQDCPSSRALYKLDFS